MDRLTRRALVIIGVVLLILLALGALPSLLKSGDPYYVTAERGVDAPDGVNATVPAENLSDRSYRYTWQALRDAGDGDAGRSEPYWRGPIGFKEAFSHSPFDEFSAMRTQYPTALASDTEAYVRWENTTYRLAVTGG